MQWPQRNVLDSKEMGVPFEINVLEKVIFENAPPTLGCIARLISNVPSRCLSSTKVSYLEVILLSVHAKDAALMKQKRFFSMQGNAQCSKESGKIPSLQMQENMT